MSEFGRQGRKRKNSGLSYPSPLQQRLTYHLCWQWRYNLGSNRSLFISIVKEEPFTFEWRMWCQYHFWSTPLQCFCLLFLTDWSPTFFRPKGQQYINKQSWFDRCNGYLCRLSPSDSNHISGPPPLRCLTYRKRKKKETCFSALSLPVIVTRHDKMDLVEDIHFLYY